jgi:hypothetical protein
VGKVMDRPSHVARRKYRKTSRTHRYHVQLLSGRRLATDSLLYESGGHGWSLHTVFQPFIVLSAAAEHCTPIMFSAAGPPHPRSTQYIGPYGNTLFLFSFFLFFLMDLIIRVLISKTLITRSIILLTIVGFK